MKKIVSDSSVQRTIERDSRLRRMGLLPTHMSFTGGLAQLRKPFVAAQKTTRSLNVSVKKTLSFMGIGKGTSAGSKGKVADFTMQKVDHASTWDAAFERAKSPFGAAAKQAATKAAEAFPGIGKGAEADIDARWDAAFARARSESGSGTASEAKADANWDAAFARAKGRSAK